jgi:hypothetical protein
MTYQTVLGVQIEPTPDGALYSTTLSKDDAGYRLTQRRDAELIRDDPVSDLAADAWLLSCRRRLPGDLVPAA